jgi:hypothetical protein
LVRPACASAPAHRRDSPRPAPSPRDPSHSDAKTPRRRSIPEFAQSGTDAKHEVPIGRYAAFVSINHCKPHRLDRTTLVAGEAFQVRHLDNAKVRLTEAWLFDSVPSSPLPIASRRVVVALRNI